MANSIVVVARCVATIIILTRAKRAPIRPDARIVYHMSRVRLSETAVLVIVIIKGVGEVKCVANEISQVSREGSATGVLTVRDRT